MVTLASSNAENITKLSPLAHASRTIEEQKHFNIAYALQSSLELDKTLEIFFKHTQDFVTTSSLQYHSKTQELNISLGKDKQHSITYSLSSDNLDLGKITFTREKKFAEPELSALEILTGILFLPLRNALLYRDAVKSSLCDSLTEIGNRKALNASFARELKLAKRYEQPLSILLIDVDHFKKINDSVGHQNGDKALVGIVKTVQETLRETDQIFRFGGEEFIVLLSNTGNIAAKIIGDRIRYNVESSPIPLPEQNLECTVSIGISTFDGMATADELIQQADSALYLSKKNGRNRVECWRPPSKLTG